MPVRVYSLSGNPLMRLPRALLFCSLLAAPALAGDLSIVSAWLREPPPGQTGAAIYLEVRNAGSAEAVLTGAEVEGAASASVHGHTMHEGMMHMGETGPLRVAPGASLVFEPAGYHVMVGGLAARPVAGGSLPFCLMFDGGARACAEARVKGVTGN